MRWRPLSASRAGGVYKETACGASVIVVAAPNAQPAGAPWHILVEQLRFARSEFVRGIDGVSADDATRRLLPMPASAGTSGIWHGGSNATGENSPARLLQAKPRTP